MDVTDFGDIMNVPAIKMEATDGGFEEISDDANTLHYVSETELGLIQTGNEMLQAPLTIFSAADDDDTMQSNDSREEEVIVQLMDIRTRLSKLRSILEKRLCTDLSEYTFWLQDAKRLDSHKTLVEQCIRGSGTVQVNIQVRTREQAINILDVLKPDEEALVNEDDDDDNDEPPAVEVSVPPTRHAGAVKWVVDPSYGEARPRTPSDPLQWCVQHVKLWIQWAVRQFNLTGVRLSDWNMNGAQLCALSNTAFKDKVPSDPGDIFWTHFELLRKCKFIAIVQTDEETGPPPLVPSATAADVELDAPQAAIKKKPKQVLVHAEAGGLCGRSAVGSSGQIQLWQFLLELLTSAEYTHVIRWHGTDGEFKLLEPESVATLWGHRKHKPAMNYEKLSRALRYYYDGDMIAKVPGKRFVYKFVCDLQQLVGYGAHELAALVEEAREAQAQ